MSIKDVIAQAVKKNFCGTGKKDDMACFTPRLFRNMLNSYTKDLLQSLVNTKEFR